MTDEQLTEMMSWLADIAMSAREIAEALKTIREEVEAVANEKE